LFAFNAERRKSRNAEIHQFIGRSWQARYGNAYRAVFQN
jgi:hypothetical protein